MEPSRVKLNPVKTDLINIGTNEQRNRVTALSQLNCLAVIHSHLAKLQRVQNCLARILLMAPRVSPSLPLLIHLHWLPVTYRINVKLSTLTYRALSAQQPPYFVSLLHLSNMRRQLKSSISQQPKTTNVLSLSLRLGMWDELPITLKTSETIANFRKNSIHIYYKLHFHHKSSVVPRSLDDCYAFLFTIMLNDSVLFYVSEGSG